MPTIEERLAYLEGRVGEHGHGMANLADAVAQFTQRMDGLDLKIDRFREELSGRLDAVALKIDRFREELAGRIHGVEQRLPGRLDSLEQKLASRLDSFEQRLTDRIDRLDQKLSRQFLWLLGVEVTVLLAVIGALLRR